MAPLVNSGEDEGVACSGRKPALTTTDARRPMVKLHQLATRVVAFAALTSAAAAQSTLDFEIDAAATQFTYSGGSGKRKAPASASTARRSRCSRSATAAPRA